MKPHIISTFYTRVLRRIPLSANSSSSLLPWSGLVTMLAGVLFGAWGYLHNDAAPSQLEVIADALSLIVPLLFLVGLTGFYARGRGRENWRLGRGGLIVGIVGAGLGFAYRLMDLSGGLSTADRYGFAVGKGWPPQLLDWFPWLLVGLTLVGIASVRTRPLRGWDSLPLAMGLCGWAYYFTDFGSAVQMRAAHVLFGVLFGLSWVRLGYVLWSERTGSDHGDVVGG
jgi:hypothetical protein